MRYTYQYILNAEKQHIGDGFKSSKGNTMEMTPFYVVQRNKDYTTDACAWVLGQNSDNITNNDGHVGKWSEDVDKSANIYYYPNNGKISKLFACEFETLGLIEGSAKVYYIEVDGVIWTCKPDLGDVIFDKKSEAKKYMNDVVCDDVMLKSSNGTSETTIEPMQFDSYMVQPPYNPFNDMSFWNER